MEQLNELIRQFCPCGVEILPLENVCRISKGVQFNKSDMHASGTYPVINGGVTASGYIEQYNQDENTITISQGGASAGYVNWIKTRFWAGAHCYVLKPTDKVLNRYLFHFVKSKESKLQECQYGAGIPALAKTTVASLKIPLPPLPVQQEIVRILDNFTELTAELTAELAARRKQYEYYRDELLRQGTITHYGKIIDMLVQPITDGPHTTPTLVEKGIPFLSAEAVFDGRIHFNKKRGFITEEFDSECCRKYKPQRDDVLMVKSGSTTGKVGYVDTDERFNVWSPLAAMRVNAKNSPRFLFHLLQSEHVQKQVRTKASHGSQPNLSMRALEQFDVPIPSFDVQEEIAAVLDNLDALCNDLASGLPAEIAARQKQYEYYRDKLLTFKELEV